ncbi:hypothetical protein [Actinomadura verrucosospora]|nr:hypothetical protein [Actinomadura verrucosospora]
MTEPDWEGRLAGPAAMGRLVSRAFEDRLHGRGLPRARVDLLCVSADVLAAAELAGMRPSPADQALRSVLGVMAAAWEQAMTAHGMLRGTIDACRREVGREVEELLDEHARLVRGRRAADRPVPCPPAEAEGM